MSSTIDAVRRIGIDCRSAKHSSDGRLVRSMFYEATTSSHLAAWNTTLIITSVFVPEVHWTLERDRFRQRYGDHRCTCGDIHACCTYLAFRALCCNSIPVAGTCTAQCARGARSKAAWRDAPLLRTAKAERARRGRNSSERCPSTKNHTRHLCSPIKPTLSSFLRSAHACPVRGSIEILDRPRVCGRRSEHTLPSDDAAVPCLLSRADRAGGDSPRLWCKC